MISNQPVGDQNLYAHNSGFGNTGPSEIPPTQRAQNVSAPPVPSTQPLESARDPNLIGGNTFDARNSRLANNQSSGNLHYNAANNYTLAPPNPPNANGNVDIPVPLKTNKLCEQRRTPANRNDELLNALAVQQQQGEVSPTGSFKDDGTRNGVVFTNTSSKEIPRTESLVQDGPKISRKTTMDVLQEDERYRQKQIVEEKTGPELPGPSRHQRTSTMEVLAENEELRQNAIKEDNLGLSGNAGSENFSVGTVGRPRVFRLWMPYKRTKHIVIRSQMKTKIITKWKIHSRRQVAPRGLFRRQSIATTRTTSIFIPWNPPVAWQSKIVITMLAG